MSDPIVEEIHKNREQYAAGFNYDLTAICRDHAGSQRGQASVFWPKPLRNSCFGYHAGVITTPPPSTPPAESLQCPTCSRLLVASDHSFSRDTSLFARESELHVRVGLPV